MIRRCALLAGLTVATALNAQAPSEPRLEDFALHMALGVSGDNGVVQLPLPREVYLASRAENLADLRVFSASGRPLPYHLLLPRPETRLEQAQRDTTLFPIWAATPSAADAQLRLTVSAGTDGTLSWTQGPARAPEKDASLSAIIVDLGPSSESEQLSALRFSEPAGHDAYQAQLALFRSDDLKLWDLVAQSSLGWFSSSEGGQRLRNDEIPISGGSGRYLKLEWRQGEALLFSQVSAIWQRRTAAQRDRLELILDGQPGKHPGDVVYRTTPAIAATELGLLLAEPNTVLPVTIGSYYQRRQGPDRWLFRAELSTTFYRLMREGVERQSSPVLVDPMAARDWVLRLERADVQPPKLLLRWQPQTLIFVVGDGDPILAVGADPNTSRRWRAGPSRLAEVAPGYSAEELAQLETASIRTTPAELPAQAAPPAADSSPEERRYWLLWATLGLGVLVLGGMSWRLYQQMGQTPR